MILTKLEKIVEPFGLKKYNYEGPYCNETLFYWEEVNNDTTDGWIIKYDNWRKTLRICTKIELCDGSYHTPIRLKPWESVEISILTDTQIEYIKTKLTDLQRSIPYKQKELKALLNKKQLQEIAKDFR